MISRCFVVFRQVSVEHTYAGDPFLVTVANYDTAFISDAAYDDYGLVYNTGTQVPKHFRGCPVVLCPLCIA